MKQGYVWVQFIGKGGRSDTMILMKQALGALVQLSSVWERVSVSLSGVGTLYCKEPDAKLF